MQSWSQLYKIGTNLHLKIGASDGLRYEYYIVWAKPLYLNPKRTIYPANVSQRGGLYPEFTINQRGEKLFKLVNLTQDYRSTGESTEVGLLRD